MNEENTTVELSEIGKPEPVDVITSPPPEPEKTEEEKAKPDEGKKAAQAKPEDEAKTEEGKVTPGVQKRINEAVRLQRAAEREAEHWKGIASQNQKAQVEDKEPTPDQFENYDLYIKALATHAAKHAVSSAATENALQHVRTAEDSIWASKLAETQQHITDYQTIVSASEQEVAPHVVQAIRAAEHGPELVYHLAKHPEIASRLNELSPVSAAIELGRIEATLGTPAPHKEEAPPPKPASNAPDPITPIAAPRNTSVNLETAEMADYIAARRKQGARF